MTTKMKDVTKVAPDVVVKTITKSDEAYLKDQIALLTFKVKRLEEMHDILVERIRSSGNINRVEVNSYLIEKVKSSEA